MKQFNLEQAKAGKPVCTRNGLKVRIVCFDVKCNDDYPILALIDNTDCENEEWYTADGLWRSSGEGSQLDLMMASEYEEINEEELNKLATIEGAKAISHFVNREQSKFAYEWADLVKEAYKAGYRKAEKSRGRSSYE